MIGATFLAHNIVAAWTRKDEEFNTFKLGLCSVEVYSPSLGPLNFQKVK